MASLLGEAARRIRESGSRAVLGCEAAAAHPHVNVCQFNDNRYTIGYAFGKPVPAYAHVFHEYANNFMGNACMLQGLFGTAENPDSVLARIAYSFAAGDALAVVMRENGLIQWCWTVGWDVPPPNQERILALIRNLTWWRKGLARDFLVYGRRLKTPRLADPPMRVIHAIDGRDAWLDAVQVSAWRAPDGREAVIFANGHPEPQAVEWPLPDGCGGALVTGPGPDGGAAGRIPFGSDGSACLRFTVPALSAVAAFLEGRAGWRLAAGG